MVDDDYTPISSFPLEFPAGTNANDTQCVNISISDDDIFEEDEIFTVELAVMPHPRVMEGNAETIVYITDNDSKYNLKFAKSQGFMQKLDSRDISSIKTRALIFLLYRRCCGVCTCHGECV